MKRLNDLGRFRLDCYAAGRCEDGREAVFLSSDADREAYTAAHFPSAAEAVEDFLAAQWELTADPGVPDPDQIAETLLSTTAVVVDRALHRVAALVAFRWAELGESRLPVAMIVELPGGEVRLQAVEQYQAAQRAA
jgi:hypothetical protein